MIGHKDQGLAEAIAALRDLKRRHPTANKAEIEAAFAQLVPAKKVRSVFVGNNYAIRFSEANTGSFSNVVLSLSALRKYDNLPMVICIVRPDEVDFRLANATLLRRISHSSHTLRVDNIRGSFLGNDIADQYEGTPNRPENFETLFAVHNEFTWEENVERLVEATNAIVARHTRFDPTDRDAIVILESPARAAAALNLEQFKQADAELTAVIQHRRVELLRAAGLENVNIRGNTIEQIITGGVNAHRLEDLAFDLPTGGKLIVDIKTKLLDRASAPKAYNIDKTLRTLAQPGSVFCLFFVGLDASRNLARSHLVSVFDPVVLAATRVQMHWAGRASRGVTQLTGNLNGIFAPEYQPSVSVAEGEKLLRQLIER